jgi:hypothetical protein
VRKAWAPPFMEVAKRLTPLFICGACSCYEEGTLEEEGVQLVGRTCSGQFALRTDLVESYNTDSEFGARVSPSELPFGRELQCSGFDNL